MSQLSRSGWIALSLIATESVLAEEETLLPEVVVSAEQSSRPLTPATLVLSPKEQEPGIPADGGDLLRRVPGVDGSRMGGHGIDPIVRGQTGNQLNVISDGAYAFGGCPNRMDPPTVFANISESDTLVVIKGNQTLRYGAGGSGGTILFERNTPRFEDGEHYRFHLDGGLTNNSDTASLAGGLTLGNTMGFARLNGHYKSAENYSDGNGNQVRSAYNTEGGGVTLGYTPSDDTRVELGFERTHDFDVLFAGAGMDSPFSDSDQWRLRLRRDEQTGPFDSVLVEAYSVAVDHLMDNYSLRPLTMPMRLRVPATSDTTGGRVIAELGAAGWDWTLGVDYMRVDRNATRFAGAPTASAVDKTNSFLWPDIGHGDLGAFFEGQRPLSAAGTLTFGLRYDRVEASISEQRASTKPDLGMSPNQLYQRYYGRAGKDRSEDNVGGLLRYSHDLGDGMNASIGLSRSVRSADANERYMAANNMRPAMRWIGNPGIAPERHHALDITLTKRSERWETSLDLFYDRVSDYILRDRAHGQSGVLQNDNATIYRNVAATLAGGEWSGSMQINDQLRAGASLAYVYAENRSDGRAIAQTPPLNGTVDLNYDVANWAAGMRLTWADTQTRVDDSILTGSGRDVGETAGWWTLDLFGRIDLSHWCAVHLGVNNLFDRAYAYHVNRANVDPFNPEAIQVNEPGRTLWARASVKF